MRIPAFPDSSGRARAIDAADLASMLLQIGVSRTIDRRAREREGEKDREMKGGRIEPARSVWELRNTDPDSPRGPNLIARPRSTLLHIRLLPPAAVCVPPRTIIWILRRPAERTRRVGGFPL